MAFDDESNDERPRSDGPLPPEDRLWRHPSEIAQASTVADPVRQTPIPQRRSRTRTGAALAGATLTGALVAVGAMWITRPTRVVTETSTRPAAVATGSFAPAPLPTEDLAAELAPTLAAVDAQHSNGWSSGTGIWLDDQGTVAVAAPLTTGTSTFLVTRPDGKRVPAELIATDPATGISVLEVAQTSGTSFDQTPAPPSAGRQVAIIGAKSMAPSGEMTQRVTTATVSTAGLRLTVDGSVMHDVFQLDRALPAEAIGSVVVDGDGMALGIVLIASGTDNLAVVAPASSALDAARALRDDGAVAPGHLGVEAIDVDPGIAGAMEIPGGAHLTTVEPGSAAAGAGLQVNDVIVAIDDQPIAGASDLVVSLRASEPASTVTVSWRRGTDEQTAQVVLG